MRAEPSLVAKKQYLLALRIEKPSNAQIGSITNTTTASGIEMEQSCTFKLQVDEFII